MTLPQESTEISEKDSDIIKEKDTQTLLSFKKMQGADLLKPYLFSFVHFPQVDIFTSQTLPAGGALP